MTIAEFIAEHRIGFSCTPTQSNPNMPDMPAGSRHWICGIRCAGKVLTVPFSQGPAIEREPTAADVLDCLASDAASLETSDGFEGWAADLGFDTDSRKAERTYNATKRQTDSMRYVLGEEAFRALLFDVERL